jgi:hypothetical protein
MLVAIARSDTPLDICRLIVAAVYFWSGAHKINPEFARETLPWMLGSLPYTAILGYAAPIAEMAIAVGLLTAGFRRAAVIGALAMHAFILICIGVVHPFYDVIVWPWNVAMCVFVVLLLWNYGKRIVVGRTWFPRLVLLLFGIAPVLSVGNLWDGYLSFALYSGNNNSATIYMADAMADRLPPAMQDFITENDSKVDELDWSFGELNVPPYAEPRVLKSIGRHICAAAGNPKEMVLVINEKGRLVWAATPESVRLRRSTVTRPSWAARGWERGVGDTEGDAAELALGSAGREARLTVDGDSRGFRLATGRTCARLRQARRPVVTGTRPAQQTLR